MRFGRSSWGPRVRLAIPAGLVLVAFAISAQPASGATTEISGSPLTIWIGDNGSFQELVEGNTDYSFFPPSSQDSNAGFVLAFPSGQNILVATLNGTVWGWTSLGSGPTFSGVFTPQSQGSVTGTGSEGDPYMQVTKYRLVSVIPLLEITQTTSYVNGSSTFVIQYRVSNLHPTAPIKFRALVGADLYLNDNDCGTGVFDSGVPRFVGGTSLGRVGGFTEEASSPWTHYFEGQVSTSFNNGCQSAEDQHPDTVWNHIQNAANGPGFPDTVNSSTTLDNGIGVQWDQYYTTGLAAGATSDPFQLNTLGTVPGTLNLTPSSQSVSAGAQAALSAIVTDGTGAAASGVTVRFTTSGANAASGAVTTDSNGQAPIVYSATKAGTDTVTAFHDIDGNGSQGQAEPNASATVNALAAPAAAPSPPLGRAPGTRSDRTRPRVRIIVPRSVKRRVLLKGLVTAANSNEGTSLRFELLGPAKPRAKTFRRKLARKSLPFGRGGTRAVVLKAKAKKLIRTRKFKVRVRVTATDRAGNRAVATKLVRIK
jgi:hypothetical protein